MSQFNDLHNRVAEHAESYAQSKGITLSPPQHAPVNTARAGKIAQAYDQMEHTPNDPQTQAAYGALISETLDQYHHIRNQGVKFSPMQEGQDNPYSSGSQAMLGDLGENNHMWFYPSDQGFGSGDQVSDHPLMDKVDTADGPMVANDLFRMVHDYFGHAKEGHQFGANGEEAAWNTHMQMYSPLAQKALTSETRGQNSWVNFGPHGESNRANPQQTVFADQKAGLLPDWTMEKRELMKKTEINSKIRLLRKEEDKSSISKKYWADRKTGYSHMNSKDRAIKDHKGSDEDLTAFHGEMKDLIASYKKKTLGKAEEYFQSLRKAPIMSAGDKISAIPANQRTPQQARSHSANVRGTKPSATTHISGDITGNTDPDTQSSQSVSTSGPFTVSSNKFKQRFGNSTNSSINTTTTLNVKDATPAMKQFYAPKAAALTGLPNQGEVSSQMAGLDNSAYAGRGKDSLGGLPGTGSGADGTFGGLTNSRSSSVRKTEQYFQSLQKSKNVRAERKRIFGESGEPHPDRVKSKDNYRNQIEALKRLAGKRYGLELQPSKGKFYDLDRTNKNRKKSGLPPIDDHEIRESGEYEASDDGLLFRPVEQKSNPKPDWRSGDLEHQRHVGATVHEMSHMEQGKGKLADIQNKMDQGSSVAGSKYGGRAKQMQGEIQPMALENKLRRRAGIPAHGRPQYTDPRTSKEVLTQDAPPRVAVDNNKEYATRVIENDTGKVADLIAQSGNLSPKNAELLDQVDGGERKYTPDQGWSGSNGINAKINQKARVGPSNYFRDKLNAMQNVVQLEAPLMEVDDDAPLEDDTLPMAKVQLAKQTMTTAPTANTPVAGPSGASKGMPPVKPQQPVDDDKGGF